MDSRREAHNGKIDLAILPSSSATFANIEISSVPDSRGCSDPGYSVRYSYLPADQRLDAPITVTQKVEVTDSKEILLFGFIRNEVLEVELQVICPTNFDRYYGLIYTGFGGAEGYYLRHFYISDNIII